MCVVATKGGYHHHRQGHTSSKRRRSRMVGAAGEEQAAVLSGSGTVREAPAVAQATTVEEETGVDEVWSALTMAREDRTRILTSTWYTAPIPR